MTIDKYIFGKIAIKEKEYVKDIFIMGTGSEGLLKVLPETREFFKKHNIKLYTEKTAEAVKLFNKLQKEDKKVMAGFHITC